MLVSLKKRPADNPAIAWRPYVIRAAIYQLRHEVKERKRVILFSELDKEGRRELLAIKDPHPTPEKCLERKEIAEILWAEVKRLSPREAEVLTLIARGYTNREIAETLVISVKTASVHVSHILRKLGAPNRLEAAAIAHRLTAPHGG